MTSEVMSLIRRNPFRRLAVDDSLELVRVKSIAPLVTRTTGEDDVILAVPTAASDRHEMLECSVGRTVAVGDVYRHDVPAVDAPTALLDVQQRTQAPSLGLTRELTLVLRQSIASLRSVVLSRCLVRLRRLRNGRPITLVLAEHLQHRRFELIAVRRRTVIAEFGEFNDVGRDVRGLS